MDKCVLDESSDEDKSWNKKKGKKSGNRQLWMQVQSVQGKSTLKDSKNSVKHKASENQEQL
jgi:hypothetical protein